MTTRFLVQAILLLVGFLGVQTASAQSDLPNFYIDFEVAEPCNEICQLYWHDQYADPLANRDERIKSSKSKMKRAARTALLKLLVDTFSTQKPHEEVANKTNFKAKDVNPWSLGVRVGESRVELKLEYKF